MADDLACVVGRDQREGEGSGSPERVDHRRLRLMALRHVGEGGFGERADRGDIGFAFVADDHRRQERRAALTRAAASATAASRAALASSSVRVRSGARKRSASASDLRPSPTCGPA